MSFYTVFYTVSMFVYTALYHPRDQIKVAESLILLDSAILSLVLNLILEAAPGFEPGIKDLQSSALPLGYAASKRITY